MLKTNNSYIIILIFAFLSINLVSVKSEVNLDEGSRYFYSVLCTDICGFDIWDNSKLPANLYIEIKENKSNQITIFTSFNLTISVNNSIDTNSNRFTFTEHFDAKTRENLEQQGRYSWQWINEFDNYINVSVPAIFLVHSPASYINNTYLLLRAPELEDLDVSNEIIQTQKYEGNWEYNFTQEAHSIRVISQLVIYFDLVTGLIVQMELEMSEVRSSLDHKIPIIDPIGSFKMVRTISSSSNMNIILLSPLFAVPILVWGRKRINSTR
ncbi:MAG: hypothetical protein ACFFAU_13795 [Candidatus Hodarchaeota archaeon]